MQLRHRLNDLGWLFAVYNYNDVMLTAMASQITSLTIVYSYVYSRRRSKKTSKLRVTGLCEGNSPVTGEFPAQRTSNADKVSIWWRHHISSRINYKVIHVVTCRETIGHRCLLIHSSHAISILVLIDNAITWLPRDFTNDKLTLVLVMACCHQATSHYKGQCWPSSMSLYGITRSH